MIIKSHRIASTASLRRLVDHLLHGEENDSVEVIQGSEQDIADAWRDARVRGSAKALRVWIVAPDQETTLAQAFQAFEAIAEEFLFDLRQATIFQHGKKRATAVFDQHWHLVVGEVDPVSGRVLSSSHDHARHEYISRTMEARWGHEWVLGRHTNAVLARMRREGHHDQADSLSKAHARVAEPPREAFTTAQHA